MDADADPAPVLQGERIRLRPWTETDIDDRQRLGTSAEVGRGFGANRTEDGSLTRTEAAAQVTRRWGPGPHWTIADDRDRFIGNCRLAPLDAVNRLATFAIGIVDPTRLGQGLGTEAGRLVVDHGFATLGLHRIELVVLADNPRAIASYRAVGFEVEARHRHRLLRPDGWVDDLAMVAFNPAETGSPSGPLRLRPLGPHDEAQFRAAHEAALAEGRAVHRAYRPGRPWADFLDHLEQARHADTAPPGLVPETWLGAFVGEVLVGTASIRHELTPRLLHEGGSIGYRVVDEHRRQGHATEILRQCLVVARSLGLDPVLVTCDDDNVGSAAVIERCGGLLENKVPIDGGVLKRRYWIH